MSRNREPRRARPAARACLCQLAIAAIIAIDARNARGDETPSDPSAHVTVVRASGAVAPPGSDSLPATAARDVPGAAGDPGVAAQNLAGVARPAPGATGLVMWGATATESRITFDGVEIPALYHFGGFRSTVGAELVDRIDVVPGAYGVEDGRAAGGLVRVTPPRLDGAATHLTLDLSPLDAGATVRTGPAAGWRVAAAARWSVLDRTYGRFAPASTMALYPIPRYADAQLEIARDVAPRATLRALVLLSSDRVHQDIDGGLPAEPPRTEVRRQSWWRAALIYEERDDDDGFTVMAYGGADSSGLDQRFGPTPALQTSDGASLGLRATYRARLAPGLRLRAGVDGWLSRATVQRSGSLTVPAREGDVTVFGQPPGDDVNTDAWSATVGDVGAFVALPLTLGAWLIVPGLRADAFPVDGSRALPPVGATPPFGYAHLDGAVDPRLSVVFAPSPRLVLTGAVGVYHQPVDPADLSAVFGSPSLRPARASHATAGVSTRLAGAEGEATAFYRRFDDLTERSLASPPALAQALSSDGQGRSFGLQVAVRRSLGATRGWLAYTASRAERWAPGMPARLFDFDQTHVATAVATHRRGGWMLSARVRYATGMPRTPVVGSFFDVRDGIAQPLFGPQNSTRLPAFFQTDLRVDRTWSVKTTTVTLSLDVENASARRNAEEIVHARDYATNGYLTGPPTLVFLGLRIAS
jgi:hypothetical protein